MNLQENFKAIVSALPSDFMKELKATNLLVASARTIRFDIPETPTGINRVKVTIQPDGDMRLRTYKIEEVKDVPNISPDSLQGAIKTLAGIDTGSQQ